MKRILYILFIILFPLLLSSCSSKPKFILPPEWNYEKEAIRLHFTGDPSLNLYQKKAHSLVVCIYQLKDLNGFNQLADERDGLPKLLECSRFDPGVTNSRRIVVQPGRQLAENLDRSDGARHLGIVAGYYDLHKENSLRTVVIPITGEKVKKTLYQKPAKIDLDIYFGCQEIRDMKVTKEEKEKK